MNIQMTHGAKPPFRNVNYLPRRLDIEHRADGSIIMRNPHPLRASAATLIGPLRRWATEEPDRIWLAKRKAKPKSNGVDDALGPWEYLSYAQANDRVNALAAAFLARGLTQKTPLMILSGNSIEHALMTYGAILAGVPVAPISPSYSLMSSDFGKLKYVVSLIAPKMIFVQDSSLFEQALAGLDLDGIEVISADGGIGTSYAELLRAHAGETVEENEERLAGDKVAKYLFTSGSTGMPKAVIMTQRMLCVNAIMPRSMMLPEDDEEPPTLLSWLPWNHCFGGNAILNNLLTAGGTLYIDNGRPVPGAFSQTIQNLREIAPTAYSSVPAGFAMLVDELEADEALARHFFSRLKFLAYGGAVLSQDIYERMQEIAVRACGERIVFTAGYGATETGPTITNVHWATERMGLLGLPLPGVELKLAPLGKKMEVRARGACITPGYYKNPDKTAEAFDEEGFYRLGDGARFVDEDNPLEGLMFDGRVAEDFKLSTGTWVSAGHLRVQILAAVEGLLQDALIAGIDREYIGLLGFPNLAACRAMAGSALSPDELIRHPVILARLAEALRGYNKRHPASSTRVARALLMAEPPSINDGELTDKGYINQAVALGRRTDLVDKLYQSPPGDDVVVV